MNNMTMAEGVALICSVTALGAGALIWVVKAMMDPLRESVRGDREKLELLIANNTEAMRDLKVMMREHDVRLDDHHTRLTIIETKHEV